jgi:hypothetical protein
MEESVKIFTGRKMKFEVFPTRQIVTDIGLQSITHRVELKLRDFLHSQIGPKVIPITTGTIGLTPNTTNVGPSKLGWKKRIEIMVQEYNVNKNNQTRQRKENNAPLRNNDA